jgi:LEA14-like dessication related protein|tara:strand:+ start:224 stop:646 length:423 start_codon:yes stop_codon:yes gene_type:complete
MACKPIEPIKFQEIKNVKIENLKNNELKISADIILLNPNNIKITISEVNVGIYADNILLVKINDEKSRELSNLIESTLNISGDVNVKNLEEFINKKGLSLLIGNEKINLEFRGNLEAKAYGFKEIIDINYSIGNVKDLIK